MKMAEIFGWDTGLIRPVRISDLPHLAFRSHDCSLDSSKAIHAMNYNPTPVSAGLRMLKKAWDRR